MVAVHQDYDPTEYMRKLRSYKVYRNGRIQLWASIWNMLADGKPTYRPSGWLILVAIAVWIGVVFWIWV